MKTIKLDVMPTSLFDDDLLYLEDNDVGHVDGGGSLVIRWNGIADGGVLLNVVIVAAGEYEEWDDDTLIHEAEVMLHEMCGG